MQKKKKSKKSIWSTATNILGFNGPLQVTWFTQSRAKSNLAAQGIAQWSSATNSPKVTRWAKAACHWEWQQTDSPKAWLWVSNLWRKKVLISSLSHILVQISLHQTDMN